MTYECLRVGYSTKTSQDNGLNDTEGLEPEKGGLQEDWSV